MSELLGKLGLPRWVLYPAAILATGAAAASAAWYIKPALFIKASMRRSLSRNGFRQKFVKGKHGWYSYAEKGKASPGSPSLVLVPGMTSSKEIWISTAKSLPADAHIVLIDLPGHGDSSVPAESMTVSEMCSTLHEMIQSIGLSEQPFHLAGASFGGSVAGLYASQHPTSIDRLTLVSPAIQCPIETDFVLMARNGQSPMVPTNLQEITTLYNMSVYDKSVLPTNPQVLKGILQLQEPMREFHNKLFADILTYYDNRSDEYEEKLRQIKAPVQVIWGQEDEIRHVSGASLLEEMLLTCRRVDILEQCGHTIYWEQPAKLAAYISDFHHTTFDMLS